VAAVESRIVSRSREFRIHLIEARRLALDDALSIRSSSYLSCDADLAEAGLEEIFCVGR